jgi:Rnl2 family RNA ligase
MAANDKPPFQKFAKMEEDRFSDKARIPRNAEFVVTEKIHGSNFCVIIKNDAVFFAKRTAVLAMDDDFYSFRSSGLAATLTALALEVPNCLKEKFSVKIDEKESVYIYGELCGGKYPHPDVKKASVQPVQQGIWYCPDIQFVGFDMCVGGGVFFNEMREDAFELKYLDFDIASGVCKACGINFVPPLCRGTKNECFDFNFRFVSSIGEKVFGLPPLPESDTPNLAEGVVVRCCKEPPGGNRAILKRKSQNFKKKNIKIMTGKKPKKGELAGQMKFPLKHKQNGR